MVDLISYEELRKIQNAERDNRSLYDLEDSFFEKVKEYVAAKKKLIEENKGKDNTFSQQTTEKAIQELKNIDKILKDLCARRQKKIILQAITNLTAKVHNTESMLPEEEELYNITISSLKENGDFFMGKFEQKEKTEEMKKEDKEMKLVSISEDMPSFLWKDNNTYGPFKKEDVVNLPIDVGEILIKQGKANEIIEAGK